MKASRDDDRKSEMLRRLRLGDLRRLFRDRYGPILPDDDAGRDDLRLLLLYVSAGPNAFLKMPRTIEAWAPWMQPDEAEELVDDVNRTPHLPTAKQLGEELRVTNEIRERLKLWQIRACDMTPAQSRKWRRQKARDRFRRLRELRGAKAHSNSISRTKPWKIAGFKCRRTWERHTANNVSQIRTQSYCRKFARDNTYSGECESATPEQATPPQELANGRSQVSDGKAATKPTKPKRQKSSTWRSNRSPSSSIEFATKSGGGLTKRRDDGHAAGAMKSQTTKR